MNANQQAAIIKTSENALHAKAAAVRAGYYDDPYLEAFVQADSSATSSLGTTDNPPRSLPSSQAQRRLPHVQPIIKRGTHARVCCIDRVVQAFVAVHSDHPPCGTNEDDDDTDQEDEHDNDDLVLQVVVLGCGKDTIFFRHADGAGLRPGVTLRWFEVDHPPTVEEKARIVRAHPDVFATRVVVHGKEGGDPDDVGAASSPASSSPPDRAPNTHMYRLESTGGVTCTLLGLDLCAPSPAQDDDDPHHLMEALQRAGCDPDHPTLFVCECVLMYLPDDDTRRLLQSMAATFPHTAYLCLYEPILGDDAFGRVMEANLARIGLATPTSSLCQTRRLADQLAKVAAAAGWAQATACDMWDAYDTVVTAAQRQRGNRAEFLDEWEEFVLIMRHYCLLVAATGPRGEALCQIAPGSVVGFAPGQAEHWARE